MNRDVALKILPELFALDPDRLARFTREPHVLASLNHPNIAAIYGLEESDGVRALVLELVDGPTLGAPIDSSKSRFASRWRTVRDGPGLRSVRQAGQVVFIFNFFDELRRIAPRRQ